MKKIKQILALILVIILIGLYITTLVMAIIDHTETLSLLKASLFATFVFPVLIWAYSLIYRLLKGKDADDDNKKDDSL